MSVSEPVANADDADALRLAELGYKQELHRGMSGFSNFAVSFSIISVLAGCITTYYLAMDAGGPLAISLGLAGRRAVRAVRRPGHGRGLLGLPDGGRPLLLGGAAGRAGTSAAWAWFIGWFNFLGEVAVTAAIDFGAAFIVDGVPQPQFGSRPRRGTTFLIFVVDPARCTARSTSSASTWSRCSPTSASGGTSSASR